MKNQFARQVVMEEGWASALKNWLMIALILLFTLLYAAALLGWLRPLSDERVIAHLEPIIFVLIGYYFGRLPAQQNETALKEEIGRQTQRADAAQHAKEQMQQVREGLEEKVKNVRITLASSASGAAAHSLAEKSDEIAAPVRDLAQRHAVATALKLLDS